jgi:hypothetical protein
MSIKWEEITLEGHDVVPVDLIELLLTWCPCDLVCNVKTMKKIYPQENINLFFPDICDIMINLDNNIDI